MTRFFSSFKFSLDLRFLSFKLFEVADDFSFVYDPPVWGVLFELLRLALATVFLSPFRLLYGVESIAFGAYVAVIFIER